MNFFRSRMNPGGEMTDMRSTHLERGHTSQTTEGQEQELEHDQHEERQQDRGRRFMPQLTSIVLGESRGARRLQRRATDRGDNEGPKTPRLRQGPLAALSDRSQLPHIPHALRQNESRSVSPEPVETSSPGQQSPMAEPTIVAEPQAAHAGQGSTVEQSDPSSRGANTVGTSPVNFRGSDSRGGHHSRQIHTQRTGKPKRFLFCFPWIQSRRIRSQILRCFVSGMFLVLMLTICKYH
jgi:hypothetical protein